MLALIVGWPSSAATQLILSLRESGIDCASRQSIPLDSAHEVITRAAGALDLVFIFLSPERDGSPSILSEIRAATPAKLVAIGNTQDPQRILRVFHAGADDYLDEREDFDRQIRALLERLRLKSGGPDKPGRIVTIAAATGGCGRSVVAINLAAAVAVEHGSSVAIDFNLHGGDLGPLINQKPRHTLIDLCQNLKQLDSAMFEQSLLRHESGLNVLAAPESFLDIDQVSNEATECILKLARSRFPCVFVDLEDAFHQEQIHALKQSDTVLLLCRLDFLSVWNTRRQLDYLESIGIDRQRILLIANRHGQRKELATRGAEDALGVSLAHLIPEDSGTMLASVNLGSPAVLESANAKVSKSLTKLARRLLAE